MDIYAQDNCCPICSQTLSISIRPEGVKETSFHHVSKDCSNGCYSNVIFKPSGNVYLSIFKNKYDLDDDLTKSSKERKENEIKMMIEYYKENSRYLMKFMGVD